MKKMKHFTCDLYSQDFYFCPGFTIPQLIKAVKTELKHDLQVTEEDFKGTYGMIFYIPDKYQSMVIWVKSNNKSSLCALAHEATHAATKLLKSRGVRLQQSNDEPLAYMIQYIYGKCLRHMKIGNK